MRFKVPWSEIATLGALYAGAATWAATDRPGLAGVIALLLAVALAWAPRLLALPLAGRGAGALAPTPPPAESAGAPSRFAAAAGAIAAACAPASGGAAGRIPALAHVLFVAAFLGAALYASLTLRAPRPRRAPAALGAVLLAVAAALDAAPAGARLADGHLLAAGLMAFVVVVLLARHARPAAPSDRARLVLPAAGFALGAALLALASSSRDPAGAGHALFALGTLAAGAGLCAGAVGRPRADVARVARAAIAAAMGASFGAYIAWRLDAGAWGALAGAAATVAALPVLSARALRADGGRLPAACVRAADALPGAERLDDVAAAVLDPLRAAARDLRAPAALWVIPGERRIALDVAGAPQHGRLGTQSERALTAWLRAHPGEPVWVDALRPLEVRRPEVRPVIAALDEQGAFAAVPLVHGGDLLGALLVPRGRRTALPSADDEEALGRLARRAAGALSVALTVESSADRAREAHDAQTEAEARAARAEAERDAARRRLHGAGPVRALGSLERAWVGYGEAMRALAERARTLGAAAGPLTLMAEPGCALGGVLKLVHENSAHAAGPCVVLDGASVHPRDALGALVGDDRGGEGGEGGPAGAAGWLEVAEGGTILLQDLPALGHDAAVALLEALRAGEIRRPGTGEARTLRARIVVALRVPPAESGLPAELCERLAANVLRVPPLRERPEDLDTLVLFGIDRACRVLGRGALGIRREAMELLRAHPWPGNEAELYAALEHAAARAGGAQIAAEDLPLWVRGEGVVPPRDGRESEGESYDALERRILQSALDRAGGNKSEAARALGIARTTFLDKLRKYGLRP